MCLADRLRRHLALTEAEVAAVTRLEEHPRHYARGAVIRREHDPARDIFVLHHGWAYSQMLLHDGARQILRVELPGDMLGGSGIAFARSSEAVVALTDAVVCAFDKVALRRLHEAHPRLAGLLHLMAHADRVAMADRLASLGRTPARARVAALLVDTMVRLRASDPAAASSARFALPMTQEEIGDATGLTAVHVNRMLRSLNEEGLIRRSNGQIRVHDEARLRSLAGYVDRYAALDTSWLPPPRG